MPSLTFFFSSFFLLLIRALHTSTLGSRFLELFLQKNELLQGILPQFQDESVPDIGDCLSIDSPERVGYDGEA